MLLGNDYSININRFPYLGIVAAVAGSDAEAKFYREKRYLKNDGLDVSETIGIGILILV